MRGYEAYMSHSIAAGGRVWFFAGSSPVFSPVFSGLQPAHRGLQLIMMAGGYGSFPSGIPADMPGFRRGNHQQTLAPTAEVMYSLRWGVPSHNHQQHQRRTMELSIKKPSKKTRVGMAIDAMTTVDAMKGQYRATRDRTEKEEWIREALEDPQLWTWAGQAEAVPFTFVQGGQGGAGIGIMRTTGNGETLRYVFGPTPMSDVELARTVGYSLRHMGWPAGSRKAAGLVHDTDFLMLTIAALHTHSPARAKELWQLFRELKLNISVPDGGWDPETWA
jgi:hypothetical protein